MPSVKGYGSKHVNDRTKNPGTVKSGKITADAFGPQQPLGQVSLARRGKGYEIGKRGNSYEKGTERG